MNFDFSTENASQLLFILSAFLPVIATYLVSKTEWIKEIKAAIAFALSALTAFITAYANGALVESFWSNFFAIYTAAQAIYWTFFKGLGLEKWIAPKEAVAGIASNQIKLQVAELSDSTVAKVLNPNVPIEVVATTKVVDQTSDFRPM